MVSDRSVVDFLVSNVCLVPNGQDLLVAISSSKTATKPMYRRIPCNQGKHDAANLRYAGFAVPPAQSALSVHAGRVLAS